MRNLKKFLALVLAFVMAMSLMITVNASSDFTDADTVTDEFAESVEVLTGMGVIKGYDEDGSVSFKPTETVTRAEMAAFIYRLATGDAEENQAPLYAGTGTDFTDVQPGKWYDGVVGYCANNNLIVGYNNNTFQPSKAVTGTEALIMILRAVGYDQGGEFQTSTWATNAYSRAQSEGLLVNVNKTNYASTLSQPATRELVAELLFRAAQIPTVTWSPALGYNKYTTNLTTGNADPTNFNPTLGWTNYGLTSATGIVLGNQATGEKSTKVGFTSKTDTNEFIKDDKGSYAYVGDDDANITVPFAWETGLDMFGHKTTVWYDGRTAKDGYTLDGGADNAVEQAAHKTYAMFDNATLSAFVYAESGKLSDATPADATLGAAAKAAGFSVETDGNKATASKAMQSDVYSRIDSTTTVAAVGTASPVNMYYLVSNNSGKTVDVIVTLSAEVGKITEKNTTAATQYLILGNSTDNVSAFGNGTGTTANNIYLKKLTPGSVQDIGALVTAWQVKGTTKAANTLTAADYLYQLDAMKTETKTVSSYVQGAAVLDGTTGKRVDKVNFTDGTSMELSGITLGNGTKSKIISKALPIVAAGSTDNYPTGTGINLKAGTPYTVYVDVLGRFISMTTTPDIEFIYGTFADFEIGGLGTGTSKYAITGVSKDGQLMINRDLVSMDGTPIVGNVGTTYNTLDITMKDYGDADSTTGNQIKEGANTGFMIDANGNLTAYTGSKMVTTDSWAISANDVAIGVARVKSNSVDYLLNENTQFYVVEGSGSATLKVTPYKGIKALLDGNNSAEISFTTGDDEVVFWTEEDLYGTTATGNNHNVATVILSDTNLTHWGANTMFYSFNQEDATGLVLPGAPASVAQYELYANGEKGTYFIDTSKSVKADGNPWDGDLEDTDYKTDSIEQDTFYTLTKVDEINGVPVYRAVAIVVKDDLGYADGLNTGVTYNYIAVNNLNFANLEKGNGDLIFNVANAKICDVEYKDGTLADPDVSVTTTRSEITTIAELNNMISVRQTNGTDPVYDCTVSVVYDNNNVVTIYITEIGNHTP